MKNNPSMKPKKGSAKHIARLLSWDANLKRFAAECNIDFGTMKVIAPIKDDGYRERGNTTVLERLGLSKYTADLKGFWPARGHHWDGVISVKDGDKDVVLLIEAKAHIGEMNSSRMNRKTPATVVTRERALCDTAHYFGIEPNVNWTGAKYQTANRLAFAYFLSKFANKPACVVYVLFTGDKEMSRGKVATKEMWEKKFNAAIEDLGLPTDDSEQGKKVKSMLRCVIVPVEELEP